MSEKEFNLRVEKLSNVIEKISLRKSELEREAGVENWPEADERRKYIKAVTELEEEHLKVIEHYKSFVEQSKINENKRMELEHSLKTKRSRMKEVFSEFSDFLQSPSVNKDEAFKFIGEFIVKFSHLETLLKFILQTESNIEPSLRTPIIQLLDIPITIKLLREFYNKRFEKEVNLQRKFIAALDKCFKVNEWRVRVAHGMWILEDDLQAKATHFSRQSLRSVEYFGKIQEIKAQTTMIEEAYKSLIDAMLEAIDHY